jgi:hypothetical protein
MAKIYILELSPIADEVTIPQTNNEGKTVDEVKIVRELEIIALKNMFRFTRSNEKNIDTGRLITDCIDQVENLTDKDAFIEFTEGDLKYLKTGYEAAAQSGTGLVNFWFDNCRKLMNQICKPMTKDEYRKKNGMPVKITEETE